MSRPIRRNLLLLVSVVCLLVIALGASQAFACSCVPGQTKKRLKHSDAAAEVEVLKVRQAEFEPGIEGNYDETWFKVRLIRVHKGPERLRSAQTARIYTGPPIDSCSWAPREGAKLGLLLARHGRDWYAGICDVVGRRALRNAAGDSPDERSRPPARPRACRDLA